MSDLIAGLLSDLFFVPLWAVLFSRTFSEPVWDWIKWMAVIGIVLSAAWAILPGERPFQTGAIIASLFWLAVWLWHHTRTRRKRAAELLGAKTRALRDALVRKTRQALQPRPVLQPVPVR